MEVVVKPQRKVDHLDASGNDLGLAAEAGQEMADVAVVLLDGKAQVLAGESLEGFVVTATQYPGDGAAADGIIRAPNPKFSSFF